jgi:GNAT superfamily N-acetyltransferase
VSKSKTTVHIQRAEPSDGPALLSLIDALAAYEKLKPPNAAAKKRLLRDMFSPRPRIECHLAVCDGRSVGYALILETYSSFLALPTLYLEDIFVLPSHRGRGVGYALFRAMVAESHRRGCGRMEWTVLDWNQPAIDFYKRLGAVHMKEWHLYRLVQSDMKRILDASR